MVLPNPRLHFGDALAARESFSRFCWRVMVLVGLALAATAPLARAASPYQGIYTVIDPYSPINIANLQTAAATPCNSTGAQTISPFCGGSNGILLRIPWCDFQLYHVNGPNGQPYPSCHYTVQFSNGYGSLGQQITIGDEVSPCAGQFDTCSGSKASILGESLRVISQINAQRATTGLPPLLLSVGIYAGIGTPQAVLDSIGSVDVLGPLPPGATGIASCDRLPLAWVPQFTHMYEAVNDQLLAYIKSRFPNGANIVMLKPGSISANDLEVNMPGLSNAALSPSDPGPAGKGGLLQCSSTIPTATTWLNAYINQPIPGLDFSQAIETAFGAVTGHLWGTLANDGFPQAILSLELTNGNELANVDCGINGAGACAVMPLSAGQWGFYYLQKYVQDLFNSGLSYQAAAAAYAKIRPDTFSLSPAQLALNVTNLSTSTIASVTESPCNMNNTNPADAPTENLNGSQVPVLGVGTVVGWQTLTGSGALCSQPAPNYATALQNGIGDAGLFLEIETDAAFTDLATCGPAITSALTQLLQATPPETCHYP